MPHNIEITDYCDFTLYIGRAIVTASRHRRFTTQYKTSVEVRRFIQTNERNLEARALRSDVDIYIILCGIVETWPDPRQPTN